MSYAAEPYGVFVEDLLGNLTGAVSRIRFRFVPEDAPFRLGTDEHPVASSVRVHGLVEGEFHPFVRGRDFVVEDDTVVWLESEPGVPAAGAAWPDRGSTFWVSFERDPRNHPPPVLTDRNAGSVTRTLAESFALEFAVLSRQLEMVYEAAHLDTATGRDLDNVAALVAVTRRGQLHARGQVTFRRTVPASADITILAGTLVSTADPPPVTAETTETVTLRRGTLAATAPVRALAEGPSGVAAARTLTVVHRPIFGVEEAVNTQPLTFGGGAEADEELRARTRRALETSGRSTVDAIRGALASIDEIRERDVLIEEDHLAFPGVVKVVVAAQLDEATAREASRRLEEFRPAGIRILHNLPAPTQAEPNVGGEEGGGGEGPPMPGIVLDGVSFPVRVTASVTPASTSLTDSERQRLATGVGDAIRDAVDDISIGQPVVYNRLVAAVMAVDGVLDAVLDVVPVPPEPAPGDPPPPPPVSTRVNLRPPTGTRPLLADDALEVILRGALVALDVTAEVQLISPLGIADPASALQAARADIENRLTAALTVAPDTVTPAVLLGLVPATADYVVMRIRYTAELLEEGLRIEREDVTVDLASDQQPWIRQVTAVPAEAGSA